jgi:hypothetical protein
MFKTIRSKECSKGFSIAVPLLRTVTFVRLDKTTMAKTQKKEEKTENQVQ